MIKEQELKIQILKDFTKMDFSNPMGWTGYYDTELKELSEAVETVLSMLKEKDKQIDLMAEFISKQDVEEEICIKNKTNPDWCNEDYTNCEDCIKQYFERKTTNNG